MVFLKENAVPSLKRRAGNQGVGIERYELTVAFTGLQKDEPHTRETRGPRWLPERREWVGTSKHEQTLPQGEHRVGAVSKMGPSVALCQGVPRQESGRGEDEKQQMARELGRL